MTREQWQAAWRLYESGASLPPDQLFAFLDSAGADPEVREAVRLLIEGPARSGVREPGPFGSTEFDRIGQKIGRYVLTGRLGEGGMGEVYAARDTELGRSVAVKLLPGVALGALSPDHFVQEAKAASSLNHPNIVTIYEVIHSASVLAIAMELVEGVSLRRLCGTSVPLDIVFRLGEQISKALSVAHVAGIVHCDIKPENLMLRPDGVAKVMDFGLARDLSATSSTGSPAAGTLRYMSPEQSQGHATTPASDIFSLGIVLYELSTRVHPFERGAIFETLKALNTEDPETPSKQNAHVPPYFDVLLLSMLAKDPALRPSASEVARILVGEDSGERAAIAVTRRPPRPRRTRSGLRIVPASFAAIAVLSAVILWLLFRPGMPAPDRTLARFTIDLGPNAKEGRNLTVAVSPDGTRIAYLVELGPQRHVVATRVLAESTQTLLDGTDGAEDLFFSPDGRWIGFFSGQNLKKVSVLGGASVSLCKVNGSPRGAAWGKDGYIIANLDNSRLMRIPEGGGDPMPLASEPADHGEQTWRWPQILPDGRVLFTGSRGGGLGGGFEEASIEVLSPRTGQRTVVYRGGYFGRYLPSGHLAYVHQGTLFAAPIDLASLKLRGAPVPVLNDVAGTVARGSGQFDFSTNDGESNIFVYRSGKLPKEPRQLAWIEPSGKHYAALDGVSSPLTPRLSRDGKSLAFSERGDIYVHDLERGITRPITRNGLRNTSPVWTPDGEHLVYTQCGESECALWWARTDGAGEPRKLFAARQAIQVRSISPDGRRIALARQDPKSGWDLWTLPVDPSDPERPTAGQPEVFLRDSGDQAYPEFSPDGRWIAYSSSGADDMTEAYVRAFPGGINSHRVQISTGGGQFPLWTADGKHLLFVARDRLVMRASWVAGASGNIVGRVQPWANVPVVHTGSDWNIDLAADGKRIITFRNSPSAQNEAAPVRVTVLLHFLDELKRTVR